MISKLPLGLRMRLGLLVELVINANWHAHLVFRESKCYWCSKK